MLNRVFLIGRVGRDPELRYTSQNHRAVVNFSLATDKPPPKGQADRTKDADWHNIVVWGEQAETINQYVHKGRLVFIEGRLQTRKYNDRTGVTRYITEVVANRVQFIGPGKPAEGQRAAAPETINLDDEISLQDITNIPTVPEEEDIDDDDG
ncbi:MAG: single-stranded DNA-binding protein [bacterium]